MNTFIDRHELILSVVGNIQDSIIEHEKIYACGLRYSEDKTKMYVNVDNTEYLLFDFGVQKGDTVTVSSGLNINLDADSTIAVNVSDEITLLVTDIYERDDNRVIDLSEINHLDNPAYKTTWIDSIGSIYGLISMVKDGITPLTMHEVLICAWHNLNFLYETTDEILSFWNKEFHTACPNIGMLTPIELEELSDDVDSPMYNILGMPVSEDYRGIVIKNGKKYINL